MNSERPVLAPALLYTLFAIVLLQLPAELPGSLITGQPVVLTALEASVGALAILCLARSLRRGRLRPPRMGLREPGFWVLVWLGSQFAAALLAPELRGPAIKFAMRSAGIASLFWISIQLHGAIGDRERRLRRTFGWIVALAVLVSVVGTLEQTRGEIVQPFLRAFRVVPTHVDGALRLTASFNHANQTAAFLSMVLPLAAGLALASQGGTRWVWGLAACAILYGLFGTLSRAAMVAATAVVGAQLVVAATNRSLRPAAIIGLVLLMGSWTLRWNLDAAFRHRIGAHSGRGLAAEVQPPSNLTAVTGSRLPVEVRIANRGYLSWPTDGVAPVRLGYHIFDASREEPTRDESRDPASLLVMASPSLWVFDGQRAALPGTVRPGEAVRVTADLAVTVPPGDYVVAWDLVREGVAWFSQYGSALAKTSLEAKAASTGVAPQSPAREIVPAGLIWGPEAEPAARAPRSVLWRLAWAAFTARPLTGNGPDTFRRTYGRALHWERWDTRVHANNVYLELLATSGIFGFLTWLGILIAFVPAIRSALRAARRTDPIGLALAGTLLVFSLHGLLDSFLGFYGCMGIFWIAAGLLVSWQRTRMEAGG